MPTRPIITVRRSTAPAYPVDSSVVKTGVLVSLLNPPTSLSLIADIDEFLDQEVKGPGSFSCVSGKGCKFSEPAMNNLINDVFGDPAITLDCDSGECLHYTQVPGYTRPVAPDNSRWVALSAALAALIFVAACLCKSRFICPY
jgi:hypothetical protein